MIYSIRKSIAKIKKDYPDIDISENFIRKIVKENKIQYIKSGNRYLINYKFLLNFLKLKEVKYENRVKK